MIAAASLSVMLAACSPVVVPAGELPNADGHIRRVTEWAKAIRATLDGVALPRDLQLE